MIGLVLAYAPATEPAMNKREQSYVIVGKLQPASTEQSIADITNITNGLLAGTATTYQSEPPSVDNDDVPFVSPVKRSFMVIAQVIVGGRVVQPPIDEDDIVYFDE